jgi:lipopolysaccharide/colanic/teichoic acid biosynthesis glycosyltransferase
MYVVHINSIVKENNKKNKRAFDLVTAICLFILSPLLIWKVNTKSGFLKSILEVLAGKKSWVGYCSGIQNNLPSIKKGILSPASLFPETIPQKKKDELNIVYAKDYRLLNDLEIVLKTWKNIGQS